MPSVISRSARCKYTGTKATLAAVAHLKFLLGRLVVAVVASAMGGSSSKALRSGV